MILKLETIAELASEGICACRQNSKLYPKYVVPIKIHGAHINEDVLILTTNDIDKTLDNISATIKLNKKQYKRLRQLIMVEMI